MRCALLVFCTLAAVSCAPPPAPDALTEGTFVDLSHPFDSNTLFWPTSDRFALQKVSDGVTEAGYYYAANNFSTAEHGGTHLDAPIHFARGRRTVDRLEIEQLIGAAVVVDVTDAAARDADYQVTVADLEGAEQEHGPIPEGAILLIRTGFSQRWPDAATYLGTPDRGPEAVARLHFPGLHPDAARWLVMNRSIDAVGIDTASIDYGQSTLFETHRVLFERDIPAFENLTGLEQLPPRGATIIALPMNIAGGSGAPLRAIAIVPR